MRYVSHNSGVGARVSSKSLAILFYCISLAAAGSELAGDPASAQVSATPKVGMPVQVVRYLNLNADSWKRTAATNDYSDLYTRLILGSNDTEDVLQKDASGRRDYGPEDRGWLARMLSAKTNTVTGVLTVHITDPNLTPDLALTIPLFSLSHASGLKLGNSWDTVYTASDSESPLFRIGTDTTINIEGSAKVSSDVRSQGTSLAIGALTTAIKTAAPAAKVLTTLSKAETNNTATAIDAAISSLLSRDIAELVKSDRQISTWEPGKFIEFYGCAPFIHETGRSTSTGFCADNVDLEQVRDTLVGRWAVSIACPRISIFSSKDVCTPLIPSSTDPSAFGIKRGIFGSDGRLDRFAESSLAQEIRNDDVLTFHLTSQTTVQAYVLAQQWFTSFAAKSAPTGADFAAFCSEAPIALRNSGLSTFDARIVLRAMITELPQLEKVKSKFDAGKLGAPCVTAMAESGVNLN